MQWRLSEEQEDYQQSLRSWLQKASAPEAVREWLDNDDLTTFADLMRAEGWAEVGLAEEIGGQGGGLLELALTAEELGRACAPSSDWLASALTAPALASVAQAALLVPADALLHRARPLEVDGEGRVTGRVPRVLAAREASVFVAHVDGPRGPALVTVNRTDAIVHPRRALDRSRALGDVELSSAPSQLLDVDPVAVLREASARAAVLVAADALGASERMLDLSVAYAKERHQFGVPIGSFQAVKHAAAEILVGIEAARSVTLFAAASVDLPKEERDPQWFLHAAAAKSQVTAAAARAADSALTLHGAIGYTWEHDLQLFHKRAGLDRQLAGRPEDWDDVIADELALA